MEVLAEVEVLAESGEWTATCLACECEVGAGAETPVAVALGAFHLHKEHPDDGGIVVLTVSVPIVVIPPSS